MSEVRKNLSTRHHSGDAVAPKPASPQNYSVAVVATMSAGKSTLLNALIGERLLPTKNEACTAKVFSLIDEDGATQFAVREHTKQNCRAWAPATREKLEELNESDAELIEIKGDLKNIRNMKRSCAVLLFDTPGPNNSRDKSHAEIAQKIITGSAFCSLIFVLNATQLNTFDESKLLNFIKKQVDLKIAKTLNVIFVLNKIDSFKIGEESIPDALKECGSYLRKLGFKSPIILPVSSSIALDIRCALAHLREMTRDEKDKYIARRTVEEPYWGTDIDPMIQVRLSSSLHYCLKYQQAYTDALQCSGKTRMLWASTCKAAASSADRGNVLIDDKLYRLRDIRLVERLSGVPMLEKYLENRLQYFYRIK